MKKERADKLLVDRGLAETRSKAQAMILAGEVSSGNQRIEKPGESILLDAPLSVKQPPPFVSRGGVKLAAALDHFGIVVTGCLCLDVGASTGGFTDCLLQRGASKVVAVDVGHGQLEWKLRNDPRVEVREKVNARYLDPSDFAQPFDIAVADVSFISLTLILPAVVPLTTAAASIVTLIKPQFEVGRYEVGKGGIVRDPVAQQRVVSEISMCAKSLGLETAGVIESPILGADGNREFLGWFRHETGTGDGKLENHE